jgi:hypothetical protein
MVGDRRKQPALILELREPLDKEEALERIWPSVVEENTVAPSVGQIAKTHILFASAEKPFVRVAKGTVQRRLTAGLYKDEIDELYAKNGDERASLVARVSS